MLFPIKELVSEQELQTIGKEATVSEALEIMSNHNYSQLPVIDEAGKLQGIITEQTIINAYRIARDSISLLDLSVEHCMTKPVTIRPDSDLFEALDKLKNVYAIIVVEGIYPKGILTDYDTTTFFRNLTEDLIFVQDIEITLRQYIDSVIDTEHRMQAALMRAFGANKKDTTKPARQYSELSFWEHVQLITTEGNWEKFESYFSPKALFLQYMRPVGDIRNRLAHFREQIQPSQKAALKQINDWIAARPKVIPKEEPVVIKPELAASDQPVDRSSKGKYAALEEWLHNSKEAGKSIRVSLEDIEQILGETLPDSAREHRAWWGNHYGNSQAKAWLRAGWLVDEVNMNEQQVSFRQSRSAYYPSFFDDILNQLKKRRPGITSALSVSLDNWFSFSAGVSGFAFSWALPREPVVRVELYIDTGNKEVNKSAFNALFEKREIIEEKLGISLYWDRLDGSKASRISISKPYEVSNPNENHSEAKKWAIEMMLNFVEVFQPLLREL